MLQQVISNCRICGNTDLVSLIDLGEMAFTGIFPREQNTVVPVGPLHLVKCRESGPEACGLVQLKHSFDPSKLYGANYGYRSGLNSSMIEHLSAKAVQIRNRIPLESGDIVLDVGSNDGTFLRAMSGPGLILVGMDPSAAKFRAYYPPDVNLVCDFFSASRFRREYGARKAKVVTSIAMFYDLENPISFMQDVSEVLADEGIWVFEQSYLPGMLEMTSYDTICHEHLEYYALSQIKYMADRVGLKLLDVELNSINGGSFSVVAAKAASKYPPNTDRIQELLQNESRIGLGGSEIYDKFRERVLAHRETLMKFLRAMADSGQKVFGYGASTKGNVLLQYCGIGVQDIPYIVEVNEDKFGSFTPGSRIPIISEAEGRSLKPDALLVLPWHFRDQIVKKEDAYLREGGKLVFPLPTLAVLPFPAFAGTAAYA